MRLRAKVVQVTGKTQHIRVPGGHFPAPAFVEVVESPADAGWLLLYFDEAGAEMTDTWHASLEDAKDQAHWEFLIGETEWEIVDG